MLFTELETRRLILKNISLGDRDFIFSEFSDDEVNEFLFDCEPLRNMSEADDIIKSYMRPEPRDCHRWILLLKHGGEKIGTCGFHLWDREKSIADIGYDMKKDYWGNGYMQEVLSRVIDFAFSQMALKRIRAEIYSPNVRSVTLAKKLGFAVTGEKQTRIFRGGEYIHDIYTLERSGWKVEREFWNPRSDK